MAIRECGKGHIYDSDQYGACPYCNTGRSMISFGAGNDVGKTSAPAGYNATVAPGMQGNRNPGAASFTGYSGFPVNGSDDENLGKTVAPDSYRKKMEEKSKTVGVFKKKYDLEPVVGWLVCVEGPTKGKDYHLWARINTIGRSEKMDVCLQEDMTVSKENHARLAYDPKHNNFQIIPADSTNNIYLNDEPIYVPTKLNAYDVVEFGETKMVFVPFCNDQFQWKTGR